jgi:predicted lipid-binding transport protein (Tim44 family)
MTKINKQKRAVRVTRVIYFLFLLTLLLLLAFAATAWARAGGGQSFSHGSSGHGGGGGGGGGGGFFIFELIWLFVQFCIHYPYIGLPIIAVIVVGAILIKRRYGRLLPVEPTAAPEVDYVARATVRESLKQLRAEDSHFSEILFLDFVQLIYARYMEALGAAGHPESLTPYVQESLLEELEKNRQTGLVIEEVIIGSSTITQINRAPDVWRISVDLETNYTERDAKETKGRAWYTETSLEFQRKVGVQSLGPEMTKSLNCPSCGSPVKVDQTGACAYCGKVVKPGEFIWELIQHVETLKEPRESIALDFGGAEEGTDLPTVFDPNLEAARQAFAQAYPSFGWDRFDARVKETFFAIQKAWTEQSWEAARPYETDRLFQTHLFWIERYRTQGCANKLEDIGIDRVDTAKIERDAYFDLITVRIFAHMIDYTVDAQGKVIDGNRKTSRKFSEYWTFIRKAGFTPKAAPEGAEPATGQCPSCGAPLKVSMSGVCEYCGANVTGGEFDWTLAKIDQDEVYTG